ncbi:unnamed protein product [Meganyctiphanes norvegica]|uniref:Fibrinogen C-terminal domain-containing protein n=1 Tax=Meganyctiphanes norvegica TaxID=48144 RepID=A0AAV2PXV8_MEGNR
MNAFIRNHIINTVCLVTILLIVVHNNHTMAVGSLDLVRKDFFSTNKSCYNHNFTMFIKQIVQNSTQYHHNFTSYIREVVKNNTRFNQNFTSYINELVKNSTKDVLLKMDSMKKDIMHLNKDEMIMAVIKSLQRDITKTSDDMKMVRVELATEIANEEDSVNRILTPIGVIQTSMEIMRETVKQMQQEVKKNMETIKSEYDNIQMICKTNIEKLKRNITEVIRNEIKDIEDNLERVITERAYKIEDKVDNLEMRIRSKVSPPLDCQGVLRNGNFKDGVYQIYPYNDPHVVKRVFCDMEGGKGWTTLLIRRPQVVQQNFQRTWVQYQSGFGTPTGEFWLGLDAIHGITQRHHQVLRIELQDWDGNIGWAEYQGMWIHSETELYRLHVGHYTGNVGDSLAYHNNQKFSTYDQDNDEWRIGNCATRYHGKGGFWYQRCGYTTPTGIYMEKTVNSSGIAWKKWNNTWMTLKKMVFKIRPE